MRKKFFILSIIAFITFILGITVNANQDGPKFVTPKQYSEYKIGDDVRFQWNKPYSIYGTVDYYIVAVRKFYTTEDVSNSSSGERIINTTCSASTSSYTISGSLLEEYYFQSTQEKKYREYRISVCAVMKDGTKRWSDHQYFYISAHNTPQDKPISFHIYNGFTADSKEQIYYACQNWNNSLNIGREIVNTFPYSNGTNDTNININNGINIVTKNNLKATRTLMETHTVRNSSKKLRESDIIVNTYYPWANSSQEGKYNFYNAITHEFGHVVGLTDKYNSWATEWTMYGKVDTNEGKKTTLEAQDISNGKSLFQ